MSPAELKPVYNYLKAEPAPHGRILGYGKTGEEEEEKKEEEEEEW